MVGQCFKTTPTCATFNVQHCELLVAAKWWYTQNLTSTSALTPSHMYGCGALVSYWLYARSVAFLRKMGLWRDVNRQTENNIYSMSLIWLGNSGMSVLSTSTINYVHKKLCAGNSVCAASFDAATASNKCIMMTVHFMLYSICAAAMGHRHYHLYMGVRQHGHMSCMTAGATGVEASFTLCKTQ